MHHYTQVLPSVAAQDFDLIAFLQFFSLTTFYLYETLEFAISAISALPKQNAPNRLGMEQALCNPCPQASKTEDSLRLELKSPSSTEIHLLSIGSTSNISRANHHTH